MMTVSINFDAISLALGQMLCALGGLIIIASLIVAYMAAIKKGKKVFCLPLFGGVSSDLAVWA